MIHYSVHHQCRDSAARVGIIKTSRGEVPTPVFMPVGTQASVKTLDPKEIDAVSEGIILANTYHLWLQPGEAIVQSHGSVHQFMQWPKAMLTDSGGYQVFSLSDLRKIDESGVHFRHHKSGAPLFLSPERSIDIQHKLGADIIMSFDECAPFDADYDYMKLSVERTLRWAKRGKEAHQDSTQALFGIVQGGPYEDLRMHSLKETMAIGFDGIAIGGLSVGETKAEMLNVLDFLMPHLPKALPRYLMGVGTPEDLLEGIARGIDMFDCVNPTRLARHGAAYTKDGQISIKSKRYETALESLDHTCSCHVCQTYTRSYIRHLFKAGETLGARLVSYHNLAFLKTLMADARDAIKRDAFLTFKDAFLARFLAQTA